MARFWNEQWSLFKVPKKAHGHHDSEHQKVQSQNENKKIKGKKVERCFTEKFEKKVFFCYQNYHSKFVRQKPSQKAVVPRVSLY